MTIATFPEDPKVMEYTLTPRWVTIVSEYGDNYSGVNEQARSLAEFPVFDMSVKVKKEFCDKSQMQSLWDHYMAAKGRGDTFYFFDYLVAYTHKQAWTLCGIGDGSSDTFDLPGRSTSSQLLYVNGSQVTVDNILEGTGVAGCDQAVLAAAPLEGDVVTSQFYGFRCCYGRYEKDKLDRDTFLDFLFSFGIKIAGLPWPV